MTTVTAATLTIHPNTPLPVSLYAKTLRCHMAYALTLRALYSSAQMFLTASRIRPETQIRGVEKKTPLPTTARVTTHVGRRQVSPKPLTTSTEEEVGGRDEVGLVNTQTVCNTRVLCAETYKQYCVHSNVSKERRLAPLQKCTKQIKFRGVSSCANGGASA